MIDTGPHGVTRSSRSAGSRSGIPLACAWALWWLDQYGGGLFLPLRDASGRHHQSTAPAGICSIAAKGADLGFWPVRALVIDLNFQYHPSCRYDSRWVCPLAPHDNVIDVPIRAGERLTQPD